MKKAQPGLPGLFNLHYSTRFPSPGMGNSQNSKKQNVYHTLTHRRESSRKLWKAPRIVALVEITPQCGPTGGLLLFST